MKRRNFIKNIAAASFACIGLNAGDKFKRPNFVFILVDDMGWTGLSVQMHNIIPESKSDYYQTPNLGKFAKSGMRFSNAYAPAPLCTPSRASFLTGKSPAQINMTTPGKSRNAMPWQKLVAPEHINSLSQSENTIAEVLRDSGYRTAHFGKWHLHGDGPGNHGFDFHDGDTRNDGPGLYDDPNPKDIFGITERGINFIKKQVINGVPFYLQLSHFALHTPTKFQTESRNEVDSYERGNYHYDADYAAMIKDFDKAVGMTINEIETLGIMENTYIIFMSDNGAGKGPRSKENYPLSGTKGQLYEGGIRVPLIINGPGIEPNSFCHTNVIGYDLFPTFCELAGVGNKELLENVEGISLVPLLRNEVKDDIFKRDNGEIIFHYPHYGKGPKQVPHSAIIAGNMKLIYFYETKESLLFDLSEDISESINIATEKKDLAEKLKHRLFQYLKKIRAQLPSDNPAYDPN